MSALTETQVAAPTLSHLPWWRGRLIKVVAITGLMVIAYEAFKLDYPWPTSLTFTSLSAHLDEFQAWLIDQRSAEDTGIVFTIFNWFREFLDYTVAKETMFADHTYLSGVTASLRRWCPQPVQLQPTAHDGLRASYIDTDGTSPRRGFRSGSFALPVWFHVAREGDPLGNRE